MRDQLKAMAQKLTQMKSAPAIPSGAPPKPGAPQHQHQHLHKLHPDTLQAMHDFFEGLKTK